MFQDLDLFLGLPVEPRLIAHHFQRHVHVILVVIGLDHLTETALTDHFEHFIAVRHVIVHDVDVRVLFVVVAAVVRRHDRPLFGHCPDKVHVRVVQYLLALVWRQDVANFR